MRNDFALTGAAGFVAPRHMQAIAENGGYLEAALDPHDSVGILDKWAPHAHFFTHAEQFDRHLERLRSRGGGIDYLSVCSPNWLHDAHIRMGMRLGANVICEKPLVINPRNLDELAIAEKRYGRRVWCILQLRHLTTLWQLRESLRKLQPLQATRHEVELTYITPRGAWYDYSWKGDEAKSGGIAMNLGVHFFDLLLWLFGPCERFKVLWAMPRRMKGELRLEYADVKWRLSVEADDLPDSHLEPRRPYRRLKIGNDSLDFSDGMEHLHTAAYREILAGRGFGIEDARPAIELVHQLRQAPLGEEVELAQPAT